ncbi:hypothetical protein EV700_2450 [Fluviicoccus keumensis]|uniref:Uncharacterized protein n=1 Tax=Fluviicoccus keumensis TaxID=1435465 RepID=A0A4Q7YP97_9GAMM|nr:hypothetical protein EV700_2450 [Fluviicoccus keumensis]
MPAENLKPESNIYFTSERDVLSSAAPPLGYSPVTPNSIGAFT